MRVALFCILLSGCAGGGAATKADGEWATVRTACRPLTDAVPAEPVPEGMKRFELRLARGVDRATVTVDGKRVLVRAASEQPSEMCAVIDLPPGKHRVAWREEAKDPDMGIQPMLSIAEYGPAANTWYHTLEFACTTSEGCLKDDMYAAFEKLHVPRGLHDPCGSTRVHELRWQAEHSPGVKLEDATVEMTLNVYPFATRYPSGSPACAAAVGAK